MIKLPPRYIPTPSEIQYARTVPSELKDFFGSLYGLAWQSKYTFTPDMQVGDLLDLFGISGRTYQVYTKALEGLSWLRSETHRNGCVRYYFPERFPIPSEKVTISALNAESCVLFREPAYTQNPAFSREEEEEEDESIKLNIESSSSSSSVNKTQNPAFSDRKLALLRAAGVRDIPKIMDDAEITFDDVLAQIAYCHDKSRAIRIPEKVASLNLLKHEPVSAIFYENYRRYIPEPILRAAGLLDPTPEPALEYDTEPEAETGVEESAPIVPLIEHPSLDQPVANTTPRIAWTNVLDQLQHEMPAATFNVWVKGTRPLRYEPPTLVIGAQTALMREWLSDRLSSTVVRILSGLFAKTTDVKFEKIGEPLC